MKYIYLLLLSFNAYGSCLDEADTTLDISQCYSQMLKVEEGKLKKTLLQAYDTSDWVVDEIKLSQESWVSYKNSHCGAVYASYGRGTMRLIAHPSCLVDLTKQRRIELQNNFINP